MSDGKGLEQAPLHASLRFGDDPVQYERARPPHPGWIFDAVLDGLGPCRSLDVGCGTGVAALELRNRGCEVLGVEPDGRMAAVAAERGLIVEVTTFERWDPADRVFDLVCSAQAWHWIEPATGLDIVARALRPGGRFAAFWYAHRHDPDVATTIRAARGLPTAPTTPPDPATATRVALSDRGALFTAVETRRGSSAISYSADDWLEVEASLGTNRALPAPVRENLFAAMHQAIEAIEPITVHWDTTLVTTTRRG
jgi:SAM-dependent methyltransferase